MLRDWSDAYKIGIAEIDHQHQGFFAAAHGLYDQILNCAGEHGVELCDRGRGKQECCRTLQFTVGQWVQEQDLPRFRHRVHKAIAGQLVQFGS